MNAPRLCTRKISRFSCLQNLRFASSVPLSQLGGPQPSQTRQIQRHATVKIDIMTTSEQRGTVLDPAAVSVFEDVRSTFPAAWRRDRWYLTVIAALVASAKPKVVGTLYSYLLTQPEYFTPSERQHLVRRMRAALVRCCILNGVPVVLEAVASIAAVEREEDKDYGFVREKWQAGEENKERAMKSLDSLYRNDLPPILSNFAAHKDILFMIVDIEYGLALTGDQELNNVETELVVLPAVMCQNLVGPTLWHLRCCLRVGIEKDDVELIHQAIEMVAKFAGKELDSIGRVADVKEEMHDRL